MRIIGGEFKGANIYGPKGKETRPTASRTRESLFNILGAAVMGSRFLDLFAGAGAVGFEAYSRGAKRVVMVDNKQIDLIARNCAKLRIKTDDRFHAIRGDALVSMNALISRSEKFDYVFADPPWGEGYENIILEGALLLLDDNGTLILEEDSKMDAPKQNSDGSLVLTKSRRYGSATLNFYSAP